MEANVHLRGPDLLVGHDARNLQSTLNLRTMYLQPLQRIVWARNSQRTGKYVRGIFDLAPDQAVVLLVDLKTSGPETFAELHRQLQPLRDHDYLTYWNGTTRISRPITIVASGNSPFQSVIALNATHRDIFWDAKLENLVSVQANFLTHPITYKYNRSNSYFESTEFRNAILYKYQNMSAALPNTPEMKNITSTQLEQAKSRGLLA